VQVPCHARQAFYVDFIEVNLMSISEVCAAQTFCFDTTGYFPFLAGLNNRTHSPLTHIPTPPLAANGSGVEQADVPFFATPVAGASATALGASLSLPDGWPFGAVVAPVPGCVAG
jgi:hypothetical protein